MSAEKDLLSELERLKAENARLKQKLNELGPVESDESKGGVPTLDPIERLDNARIQRFSRQLLLKEIGVKGQIALSNASVLIVGAGGLGSPSALYLASSGIGRLGIVEHDTIDLSNLHRQVIHTESRVGTSKAQSAKVSVAALNSSCICEAYDTVLDSSNAMELIRRYDVVLDCSDNVATRYLLNDACILLDKPLVSGSALRLEGQLSVYKRGQGPCYRCIFPTPPPPESVMNCSDGGVLGPVTGVIGCLQALEAIKLIVGHGSSFIGRMLLFDGLEGTFRGIKLRPRKADCAVCGDEPTIDRLQDYVQFCGMAATDKERGISVLADEHRISPTEYRLIREMGKEHVLIDTREPLQTEICSLEGSWNIPMNSFPDRLEEIIDAANSLTGTQKTVYVVCRRGNDSQLATQMLLDKGMKNVFDIRGGLTSWHYEVDPEFPLY